MSGGVTTLSIQSRKIAEKKNDATVGVERMELSCREAPGPSDSLSHTTTSSFNHGQGTIDHGLCFAR